MKETLPASPSAFYEKPNGVEPAATSALVQHSANKMESVIVAMNGQVSSPLPGCRIRIVDGNHLAGTQRLLAVLKQSKASPLPGHSLVTLDPALMLAVDMSPCEDGHAQERTLFGELLRRVSARDVGIADRNFCTNALLFGIAKRKAYFLIRQHAQLSVEPLSACREERHADKLPNHLRLDAIYLFAHAGN